MSRSQRTVGRRDDNGRGGLPGAKIPKNNRIEGRKRRPGGTISPSVADIPNWLKFRGY